MTRAEPSRVVSGADQAGVRGEAHLCAIWLRGEHDLATVSALAATLSQAVAADDADVVVDLREVAFMDASTIGVIVVVRNLLALQSRRLTLRSPSVPAQRVLEVCGLTDLLVLDPAATGATPVVGAAGALNTWVAVAATQRAGRRDDADAASDRGVQAPGLPGPAADRGRRERESEATADPGAR